MTAATDRTAAFPWDEVLAFGLGLLRLSPNDFWSMTTREFAALTRAYTHASGEPLRRDSLDRMMKAFPDNAGG